MTTRDYVTRYANDRSGSDPKTENRTLTFLSHLFQQRTILFIGYGLKDLEILEYVIQKERTAAPGQAMQARHYMLQGYFSHQVDLMLSLSQYYMQTDIQLIPFLLDRMAAAHRGHRKVRRIDACDWSVEFTKAKRDGGHA